MDVLRDWAVEAVVADAAAKEEAAATVVDAKETAVAAAVMESTPSAQIVSSDECGAGRDLGSEEERGHGSDDGGRGGGSKEAHGGELSDDGEVQGGETRQAAGYASDTYEPYEPTPSAATGTPSVLLEVAAVAQHTVDALVPMLTSAVRSPKGAARAARAHFLYLYAPFDLSIWGRLRSPAAVALLCLSSWPSWAMRTGFFTLLLAMLIVDLDEYQLMQFIMSLKGTQFITGARVKAGPQ